MIAKPLLVQVKGSDVRGLSLFFPTFSGAKKRQAKRQANGNRLFLVTWNEKDSQGNDRNVDDRWRRSKCMTRWCHAVEYFKKSQCARKMLNEKQCDIFRDILGGALRTSVPMNGIVEKRGVVWLTSFLQIFYSRYSVQREQLVHARPWYFRDILGVNM